MKTFKILFLAIVAILASLALSVAAGIPPVVGVVGSLVLAFIPRPEGVASVGVELWSQFIAENVYKQSDFFNRALDESMYVKGTKVHVPKAGSGVSVKRNRATLPAPVAGRGDTELVYDIDEFTSDPILIKDADKVALSYDAMQSVLSEFINASRASIGDWMAFNWLSTGGISALRTSGEAVGAHLGTGNRKLLTKADFHAAKLALDNADMPSDGRVCLISANMLDQLINDLTDTAVLQFQSAYDPVNGVVGRFAGFDMVMRSSVATSKTDDLATLAPDTTPADATAADTLLFWHEGAVAKALGETQFFEDTQNPTYYGDVYSALTRAGGRGRLAGGIVKLVQDTAV